MLSTISGYKTYAVAAATIAYALVHYFIIGDMSSQECITYTLGATGLGALRHGLSTELVSLIGNIGPSVLDTIKAHAEASVAEATKKSAQEGEQEEQKAPAPEPANLSYHPSNKQ